MNVRRFFWASSGIISVLAVAHCTDDETAGRPAVLLDASFDVANDRGRDAPPAQDSSSDAPALPDASDGGADTSTDAGNDTGLDASSPDAADAADASDAADAADASKWVFVRIDDCAGQDSVAYTTGSFAPVEANCDQSVAGTVAVCWDQTTYTNNLVPNSDPGCTYKSVDAGNCTSGAHPGYMYQCVP